MPEVPAQNQPIHAPTSQRVYKTELWGLHVSACTQVLVFSNVHFAHTFIFLPLQNNLKVTAHHM